MWTRIRLLKLKKRRLPVIVGLLLVVIFIALKVFPNSVSDSLHLSLDNYIYDSSLKLDISKIVKLPEGLESIVIVDIDENSLKKIGHWPWSRDKLALLTNSIREAGAIVMAFDILFPDTPTNPVDEILSRINETNALDPKSVSAIANLKLDFDYDELFRKSLSGEDSILGFLLNDNIEVSSAASLPSPLETVEDLGSTSLIELRRHVGNLSKLQEQAKNGGFITAIPDDDGIIRSAPLVLGFENKIYPSLALEAARLTLLMDRSAVRIKWGEIAGVKVVDGVYFGEKLIPTDESGRILIPFHGKDSSYRHVSAADVMSGKANKGLLKNAIVFVGSTAFGLSDFHATPVNPVFPGVDVHGYLTEGILTGQLIRAPYFGSLIELLMILTIGLALALLLPFLDALWMVLCFFASLVLIFLVYGFLFRFHNVLISVSLPLVLSFCEIGFNLTYGMLFEFRRRSQLKNLFGQYVPQEIVERMSEHPELYSMDGTSERLTVLFADVVHFTSVSESLSPQQIRMLLNRYFTPMTKIILDSDGTIDKYVGDMIMAFWGAPVKDKDHVRHALESALKMQKEAERLGPEFIKDGLPVIKMGIGLNTGVMSVGDMGSEYRRAYTVLGDSVNTASRIEGLTRFYGLDIAVGEDTRKGQDDFVFRLIDRVKVKGREEALEIFELVKTKEEASPELLLQIEKHERAMQLYFNQKFDDASKIFQDLLNDGGNTTLYNLLLDRIKRFKDELPPKEWDGATEWTKK